MADPEPMVTVENVNHPGRTSRVNAAKYTAMRTALLKAVPTRPPGLTQAMKRLPDGKPLRWIRTSTGRQS